MKKENDKNKQQIQCDSVCYISTGLPPLQNQRSHVFKRLNFKQLLRLAEHLLHNSHWPQDGRSNARYQTSVTTQDPGEI